MEIQQSFTQYLHYVKTQHADHKLDLLWLKKTYDDLTNLKQNWKQLCLNADKKAVKLLDAGAMLVQIQQIALAKDILALEVDQAKSFDYVVRRQLPISNDDLSLLNEKFALLFPHITDNNEKLLVYTQLFKLYKIDEKGLSLLNEMEYLFTEKTGYISTEILIYIQDLVAFSPDIQADCKAKIYSLVMGEKVIPLLALAAVCNQKLEQEECLDFLLTLDEEEFSYYRIQQLITLYVSLSAAKRNFIKKMNHVDINGLELLKELFPTINEDLLISYKRCLDTVLGGLQCVKEFRDIIYSIPHFNILMSDRTIDMDTSFQNMIKIMNYVTTNRVAAFQSLLTYYPSWDNKNHVFCSDGMDGSDLENVMKYTHELNKLSVPNRTTFISVIYYAFNLQERLENGSIKLYHLPIICDMALKIWKRILKNTPDFNLEENVNYEESLKNKDTNELFSYFLSLANVYVQDSSEETFLKDLSVYLHSIDFCVDRSFSVVESGSCQVSCRLFKLGGSVF